MTLAAQYFRLQKTLKILEQTLIPLEQTLSVAMATVVAGYPSKPCQL